MAKNPPNRGGTGPHKSPQAKGRGPIISNHSLNQGSNGTTKGKVAPQRVGSSPSKAKGGWYLGSKKGPASHNPSPG